MDIISYAKRNNPRGIQYYLENIASFSPHSSDSEGTSSYKKLKREMISEKRHLTDKMDELQLSIQRLQKEVNEKKIVSD